MRHFLLTMGLLLMPLLSWSQTDRDDWSTYSYSELFEMIALEKDSIFRLNDAIIAYNEKTDSLFLGDYAPNELRITSLRKDDLVIDKQIAFRNVDFNTNAASGRVAILGKIVFKKPVSIVNPNNIILINCKLEKGLTLRQNQRNKELIKDFGQLLIWENEILGNLNINISQASNVQLFIHKNEIENAETYMLHRGKGDLIVWNNKIKTEILAFANDQENPESATNTEFLKNKVASKEIRMWVQTKGVAYIKVAKNDLSGHITLDIDDLSSKESWISWDQFAGKIIVTETFNYWRTIEISPFDYTDYQPNSTANMGGRASQEDIDYYLTRARIEDIDIYNSEQAIRGKFYNYYTQRHETETANVVYVEIKDLETERLAFLYKESPSFNTFFKWKINQFLKLFSAYGTEPARAITMSVYVVLAFALVYLLFPNQWDSHGKNRIMNRYRFFLKYVNRDSGLHEVYLEDKKPELLDAEDFKSYLEEQGKTAPKFFMTTALPLYRWSVAGTKTFSWLLSKVDILKGKWSETEPGKQRGKSFLLLTAFLVALFYDIFIKMLNALMLSINTFTTLGFGEIPIKGLPRYLAIIQGFIGWFMLTIFSVSLISQLLN